MRGNASVSQSNCFNAKTTTQALANQFTFMVTSQERKAKKKKIDGGPNSVDGRICT